MFDVLTTFPLSIPLSLSPPLLLLSSLLSSPLLSLKSINTIKRESSECQQNKQPPRLFRTNNFSSFSLFSLLQLLQPSQILTFYLLQFHPTSTNFFKQDTYRIIEKNQLLQLQTSSFFLITNFTFASSSLISINNASSNPRGASFQSIPCFDP